MNKKLITILYLILSASLTNGMSIENKSIKKLNEYFEDVSNTLKSNKLTSDLCKLIGQYIGYHPYYKIDNSKEKHSKAMRTLAFSPCNRYLACGGDESTIEILDMQDENKSLTESFLNIGRSIGRHSNIINFLIFSPLTKCLASAHEDGTIKIWDMNQTSFMQCLVTFDRTKKGHENSVTTLTFSPDSKYLASGSKDCLIKIWDLKKQACIYTANNKKSGQGHTKGVNAVAFSPNGKHLVSAGRDQLIKFWDVDYTNKPFLKYLNFLRFEGNVLSFSPCSKYLAAANDENIIVFDINKDTIASNSNNEQAKILALLFSPCGKYLVAGKGNTLSINTINEGNIDKKGEIRLNYSESSILALSFSPSSKYLVSSHRDKNINILVKMEDVLGNFQDTSSIDSMKNKHSDKLLKLIILMSIAFIYYHEPKIILLGMLIKVAYSPYFY